MKITAAEFLISSPGVSGCPPPNKPEFAFIGRSNVGKSSLLNMLTGHSKLARTSATPGKTQLINHFLINKGWYMVDLPGYGFAKVSKADRQKFSKMIEDYLEVRTNLVCTFVLIDSRLEPQENDLDFMRWMGENEIPFVIVFTKTDKLKPLQRKQFVETYTKVMLKDWEEIPPTFVTSATDKSGKEELLSFLGNLLK